MNERVSIKEGGLTRELSPIDKVKANNTDGTQSIWVSKDDMHTGTLYATENGIYIASEDGYDAYSEVVIRVEKRIDDGDLIDESDTDWKDIDFDGDVGNFDELDNWDVGTLEEFSDDLEGFDDLFNDEDKWDEEKEKPITEDEMDDFDGDSISGIDPETGNEMEVSLDEDGFLDEEVLPSYISIIRDPFRLKYVDGEYIQILGIVVQAYTEDGNVWVNDNYPNGIIPLKELTYSPKKAVYKGTGGEYAVSELLPSGVMTGEIRPTVTPKKGPYGISPLYISGADVYYILNNGIIAMWVSKEEKSISYSGTNARWNSALEIEEVAGTAYSFELGGPYEYDGKKAYYYITWSCGSNIGSYGYYDLIASGSDMTGVDTGVIAWTILYGDIVEKEDNMDVTVEWNRPGDGEALADSFTISVLPDPSGGDSGGSSWDGNISYGGNDYMLNPNSVVGLSYDPDTKKVIAPNIGEYNVDQAIDVGLLIPKE